MHEEMTCLKHGIANAIVEHATRTVSLLLLRCCFNPMVNVECGARLRNMEYGAGAHERHHLGGMHIDGLNFLGFCRHNFHVHGAFNTHFPLSMLFHPRGSARSRTLRVDMSCLAEMTCFKTWQRHVVSGTRAPEPSHCSCCAVACIPCFTHERRRRVPARG